MKRCYRFHVFQYPELLIFKYMWLLVIIPKALQLAFIVFFALVVLYKTKRIPKGNVGFTIMIAIQVMAIFWQIIIGESVSDRLMASVNTVAIWILGIYFLGINKKGEKDRRFYELLTKYIVFNLIVYIALFILSRATSISSVSFLGQQLSLKRVDYMLGSTGSRFIAFMETPLAPSHMFLFSIPVLSIGCINKVINRKVAILIATLAIVATYSTHSRVGMAMCAVAYVFFVILVLKQEGVSKRTQQLFVVISVAVAGLVIALNYNSLINAFLDFFNSRSGSNEARFVVYTRSVEKAWNESPVIGIGIKYMVDNFIPYGSHSTYIGVFYKAGILGVIAFIYGLWSVMRGIKNNFKNNELKLFVLFQVYAYLFFLIFADIDGVNWVMVAVMSMWGLLINESTINIVSTEYSDCRTKSLRANFV